MNLAVVGVLHAQVVAHALGQQMAAVAGGVNQHIGCGRSHRAVQDGLERFVAGFAFFKAQIIGKDDELLRPPSHRVHNVGQVGQVFFVHLNQAQTLVGQGVQTRAYERRFAGATRTCEQHVVGGQALHELLGVAQNFFFLLVDLFERVQAHAAHVAHRLQGAVARAAFAVTKGNRRVPIRRAQRRGQHRFNAVDELLSTREQLVQSGHEI